MTESGAIVRPLAVHELAEADTIFRLAFGTFLRLPDPSRFSGDADYVTGRWHSNPTGALGAELHGELVGSNFATRWGSFGFFGPLSVHPNLWDRGVAQRLVAATVDLFDGWQLAHTGLFTFADSAKHVALYQKFGFAPRFLTAITTRPVTPATLPAWAQRFSALRQQERADARAACQQLTGEILDGLDLTHEIETVADQRLGETLLMVDGDALNGFAICHRGPRTEAGSGNCYIKFAAVRSGPRAAQLLTRLLGACQGFASTEGLQRLVVGVNTARSGAYEQLRAQRFRTEIQGVAMQRPNEPGFNRPDVFVLDDWR